MPGRAVVRFNKPCANHTNISSCCCRSTLRSLVEKLLGFVDLGRQVGASASIGVVEQHERAVSLSDLFLGDGALAIKEGMLATASRGLALVPRDQLCGRKSVVTYLSERISVASFLVILGSKPPL
jgi:hypothetical protein